MLSLTESMLIAKTHNITKRANQQISELDDEIDRLNGIIAQQKAIIALHEKQQTAAQKQQTADACSIAGYRAYVEYMRSTCSEKILGAARDAYVVAHDAKAIALNAPHLIKDKPDGAKAA